MLNSSWHNTKLILESSLSLLLFCLAHHSKVLLLIIQISLAAKDGVCLTRPSLTIRHYHTIKAIKHVYDNRLSNLRVGRILTRIHF